MNTTSSTQLTILDYPLSVCVNDFNSYSKLQLHLGLHVFRDLIMFALKTISGLKPSYKDMAVNVHKYLSSGVKLSSEHDTAKSGIFVNVFQTHNGMLNNKNYTLEFKFLVFLCHIIDEIKSVDDFCIDPEGFMLLVKNPIYFYSAIFPNNKLYFGDNVYNGITPDDYKEDVAKWINLNLTNFLISNKLIKSEVTNTLTFKEILIKKVFKLNNPDIKDQYNSEEAEEVFNTFLLLVNNNWKNQVHQIKIACNLSNDEYESVMSWYRYNSSVKSYNASNPEVKKEYEFSNDISSLNEYMSVEMNKLSTSELMEINVSKSPEERYVLQQDIKRIREKKLLNQQLQHNNVILAQKGDIQMEETITLDDQTLLEYYNNKTSISIKYKEYAKDGTFRTITLSGTIDKIKDLAILLSLSSGGGKQIIYRKDIVQLKADAESNITHSNVDVEIDIKYLKDLISLQNEKIKLLEERVDNILNILDRVTGYK